MDNIEKLLMDVKDSLERQIGGIEQEMRAGFVQLNTRFDTQAARLDRQGGLLQAGNRWSGRMNDWAEKIDVALETKDREIAELRRRLDDLEHRQ
jgi:hypothetical protein